MYALVLAALLAALPKPGATVPLEPGDGPGSDLGCLVAIDGPAYAGLCTHLAADDPEGVAQVVNDRRAFFLPGGTKVRVIDYQPGFRPPGARVRILEGKHKGRLVWTPDFYLLP